MITDLRQALKALRRAPGLTALTVLLLGLGIGLAAAAFSFANAVFLRPLPFAEPERLAVVEGRGSGRDAALDRDALSAIDAAASFESVASYRVDGQVVEAPTGAERLSIVRATPALWRTLGVAAAVGRTFGPEDARPGAAPVVVLSHDYWRSRFGADPAAVGSEIRLDDDVATVVGVMPEGFAFPERGRLWRPLDSVSEAGPESASRRVVVRLREGVTRDRARTELDLIASRLRGGQPTAGEGLRLALGDEVIQRARGLGSFPWIAVGVATMILLIACSNIAGVLLVRSVRRRGEMAIRAAIGGSRSRLIRHLLIESAILGVAGAALGALVALNVNDLVAALLWRMPEWIQLVMDWRVLAFVAVTALFIVAAVGLAPALEATSVDLGSPLRGAAFGATESARGRRLGGVQAVLQLAFAFVLVLGAALLGRSFARMSTLDFGVDADRVLQVRVAPGGALEEDPEARALFAQRVVEDARGVAGVVDAALVAAPRRLRSQPDSATLADGSRAILVDGEHRPVDDLAIQAVTPNYLDVMGLSLREGRMIRSSDGSGADPVVVLSAAVARRAFPGESPVGRTLRLADGGPLFTVVGVVADQYAFYSGRGGVRGVPVAAAYLAFDQIFGINETVYARTAAAPGPVVGPLAAALDGPALPVSVGQVETVERDRSSTLRLVGLAGAALGFFALAALGLALLGIYGVIAFRTAQRTREMGIRRALGASRDDILRLVLTGGGRLALQGILVATPLALAMGSVIGAALYDVSPADPLALAATAALFFATVMLAAWIPARRAATIEPAEALREP